MSPTVTLRFDLDRRAASIVSLITACILACLTTAATANELPHVFDLAFGSPGSGPGQFGTSLSIGARGIALDSNGNVYVADSENDRIQKFDADGTFLLQWGSTGTGDGQFSLPTGVAVDDTGSVYVADGFNDRIQKFDTTGTFLAKWGSSGSGNGQFSLLGGVTTDSAGDVYVSDIGNARVQKFDSAGTFLTQWGSSGTGPGQFTEPAGLAVDAAGKVYVADAGQQVPIPPGGVSGGGRVMKFTSDGTYLQQIGVPASDVVSAGPGEFGRLIFGVAVVGGA